MSRELMQRYPGELDDSDWAWQVQCQEKFAQLWSVMAAIYAKR